MGETKYIYGKENHSFLKSQLSFMPSVKPVASRGQAQAHAWQQRTDALQEENPQHMQLKSLRC